MSPEARRLAHERLANLLGYCDELADALATEAPGALRRRAIERLFQLIVECVADIGFDLADALSLKSPGSTREAIETARIAGVFPDEPARRFERRYISIRNRIVHDYERLDSVIIMNESNRLVEDARFLAKAVAERMKEKE